jgi:hypothetical protein
LPRARKHGGAERTAGTGRAPRRFDRDPSLVGKSGGERIERFGFASRVGDAAVYRSEKRRA